MTLSLERRRRLVELAREREVLVVEDNPYGLLRYEGEPLPPLYQLDGGDYVIYLGTFSKILSPGIRLGWAVRAAAGDGEGRARQAGRRPLHLDPDPVLRPRVLRRGPLARVRRRASAAIYRARRDAMLEALERHFPAQATWTRPSGGLFIWATLPDYIDTTDLLAKALRENVAFVPGAAAYVDGRGGSARCGSTSRPPSQDEIREGIRRIGEVIDEQVELYETITGEHPAPPPSAPEPPRRPRIRGAVAQRRPGGQ